MSDDVYELIEEVLPKKVEVTSDPFEYTCVPVKVVRVVGAKPIYVKVHPLPLEELP